MPFGKRKRRLPLEDLEFLKFGASTRPSFRPEPKPRKPPRVSVPYAPTARGKEAEQAAGASPSPAAPPRSTPSPSTSTTGGPDLTSLASGYLLSHLNDLLTPNKPLGERIGDKLGELGDLNERLNAATKRPPVRHTLGDISLGQLAQAVEKGTARVNQAGKVTIPSTRQAARRLANLREKKSKIAAPLPGLDPHQTQVLRTVLRTGDSMGATPKEKLAAIETGLVESNARNLGYGDADSEGWRQERTSIYGTGPQGPRNVKASAQRFFEESVGDTGGTRGAGMTPGQLAQTIQASAFPERYDQEAPQAQAILSAYERGGKPGPKLAANLREAEQEAQRLGIPTKQRRQPGQPDGQVRKTPTIIQVGNIAQNRFGLRVGEHPHFDQVDPVHTSGSYHYSGQAIDVSGDASKLAAFNKFVASRFGDQLAEMFFDPGINIDNGQPTGAIGGHGSHVHVAIDEPGTDAHGLAVGAYGLNPSQPVGYYGYGDSAAAARKSAQRARESVFGGVTSLDVPTAASAPLPSFFGQFQGEDEAEPEGDALSVIEGLLRRRRR